MSLTGKKLAILIAAGPNEPGFAGGTRLAQDALAEGVDVSVYCIDDGVTGIEDPRLKGLNGMKLFACAHSAERRRLPMVPGPTYSGLALLSSLIAASDRFVAFT